jgi:hypothetical protein
MSTAGIRPPVSLPVGWAGPGEATGDSLGVGSAVGFVVGSAVGFVVGSAVGFGGLVGHSMDGSSMDGSWPDGTGSWPPHAPNVNEAATRTVAAAMRER